MSPSAAWYRGGWVLAWLALVVASYVLRNPYPLDETRYLAAAWEMWVRGDFLVPHLNGEPYSHKPPLLFWLMHAGWAVFGVQGWWARLVPALCALAALALTGVLGRRLWPQRSEVGRLAPWVLGGGLFWALFTPMVMFDMLVTALVLLAILGLHTAGEGTNRGKRVRGWGLYALAGGLGILAKGPVALLHPAGLALLGPLWSPWARRRPLYWYGALVAALVVSAAIALAWALPAAHAGGEAYANAILWQQSAGRVASDFAHAQPWWWYAPVLAGVLFPWVVWPPLWRGLGGLGSREPGVRFALVWTLPVLAVLSLISAKQPHYLLPLLPGLALLGARALAALRTPVGRAAQLLPALGLAALGMVLAIAPVAGSEQLPGWVAGLGPAWGIAMVVTALALLIRRPAGVLPAATAVAAATVLWVLFFMGAVFTALRPSYNLVPAARQLAQLQTRGATIAHVGKYHGQFHFLGRLRRPLTVVQANELQRWARTHPAAYLVQYTQTPVAGGARWMQRFRGEWLSIWRAEDWLRLRP